MQYIKTKDIDFKNAFFHFTRIDNRDSIEQNGLQSVAGGENKAGHDSENPTIYFAYNADGVLKSIDVWIKWEYNILRWQRGYAYFPESRISEEIMQDAYEKIYQDFKDRIYYQLDLIEGENPEESDFSFNGIDMKKVDQQHNKTMKWMYGPYSNISNYTMETWNMNTHIGKRTIPADRMKIIECENGRTDALSIVIEIYNKFRSQLQDIDLSRLDECIEYAKKRQKEDKDYADGMPDIGRRRVDIKKQQMYQGINKISVQALGRQVIQELKDTSFLDQTLQRIHKNQRMLGNSYEAK